MFGFFKPFSAPVSINQRCAAGQGRVSDAGLNNVLTPRWKRGVCKPPVLPAPPARSDGQWAEGQTPRGAGGAVVYPAPCWRGGAGAVVGTAGFWRGCSGASAGSGAFKWGGGGSPANSHGQGARRGRAGAVSSTQRGRGGFAGTNKDSLSASWTSLRPQPGAKAAGTESELFAEVFHQINGTVLCRSSPFTRSQPPGSCA